MSSPTHLPLILASNSPRRRELLALTGLLFHVRSADVDEIPQPDESPHEFAVRMAREKAAAAADSHRSGLAAPSRPGRDWVLAADTVVVDGHRALGKPADLAEAEQMLRQLRGREHTVVTAVALHPRDAAQAQVEVCETRVPMRDYSEQELAAYLASGDSLDKAGAYGIQNRVFHPACTERSRSVDGLHGCYANVMGLPLCHVARALRSRGIETPVNVPAACKEFTEYDCPVYESILDGQP